MIGFVKKFGVFCECNAIPREDFEASERLANRFLVVHFHFIVILVEEEATLGTIARSLNNQKYPEVKFCPFQLPLSGQRGKILDKI